MIQLISQIVFWLPYLGTTVILVGLFCIFIYKFEKFHRLLNIAVLLAIAFFLLSWMSQLLSLYLVINALPMNQDLLHGLNSFFTQKSLAVSQSYLITVIVTILLYIVALLLKKFQKRPYFNNFTAKVVLITTLSLGFSNVLPLILTAFFLVIIFQLFLLIFLREKLDRTDIVPFLLLGAIIIRILMIFPLYSRLLGTWHLI